MKKIIFCIAFVCLGANLWAGDVVQVKQPRIPVLIDRQDNVLLYIRLEADNVRTLDEITLAVGGDIKPSQIKTLKLYYAGTEAVRREEQTFWSPVRYISRDNPGATRSANGSYSIKRSEVTAVTTKVTLKADQKLFPGINYFWVSVETAPDAPPHGHSYGNGHEREGRR